MVVVLCMWHAGSVRFVRDMPGSGPGGSSGALTSASPYPAISWGGGQSHVGLEMARPGLEAILGPDAARSLTAVDVRRPLLANCRRMPHCCCTWQCSPADACCAAAGSWLH